MRGTTRGNIGLRGGNRNTVVDFVSIASPLEENTAYVVYKVHPKVMYSVEEILARDRDRLTINTAPIKKEALQIKSADKLDQFFHDRLEKHGSVQIEVWNERNRNNATYFDLKKEKIYCGLFAGKTYREETKHSYREDQDLALSRPCVIL
jgi:hypothetical protein